METKRLILRLRSRQYLEKIIAASPEGQMDLLGITNIPDLQIELNRIDRLLRWDESEYKLWDVIEKESKKLIGNCGFHNWKTEHLRAEIGYWMNEKYRRKGFMKEAVEAMLAYGFNEMKLNRIEALLDPNNVESKSLVEYFNFVQEGLLRQHYHQNGVIHDSLIYSLLKSEFEHPNQI